MDRTADAATVNAASVTCPGCRADWTPRWPAVVASADHRCPSCYASEGSADRCGRCRHWSERIAQQSAAAEAAMAMCLCAVSPQSGKYRSTAMLCKHCEHGRAMLGAVDDPPFAPRFAEPARDARPIDAFCSECLIGPVHPHTMRCGPCSFADPLTDRGQW